MFRIHHFLYLLITGIRVIEYSETLGLQLRIDFFAFFIFGVFNGMGVVNSPLNHLRIICL